jgi:histidinol-phosphate aminotransferase
VLAVPDYVHAHRRRPDSRINLSSNELLSRRLEGIHRSVAAGLTSALLSSYPVVADQAAHLAGYFGVQPDELVLTPGSDSALRLVCAHHAKRESAPGPLILQDPNYIAWAQTAAAYAMDVIPVRAESADPAAQAEQMLQLAESSVDALMVLSVPNGLSGGCVSPEALDKLTAVAARQGHLLVIDACYQAFNGSLTEHIERRGGPVLVVQSMSKSHGLAGARVSVLCGAADVVASLGAGPLEHAVSGPTLLAATNAVDRHDDFAVIWSEIARTRDWCVDRLRGWGLRPLPSAANFVTVPVGSTRQAAAVTAGLSESGYRIRDLSDLPGLSGCVRFSMADQEVVERFLPVLERALSAGAGAEPSC